MLTNEQYVINFVDIITHRIADKFYIAIDKEPSFMAVSHDNRFAYCILDPTGDNFVKMGLETGAPAE